MSTAVNPLSTLNLYLYLSCIDLPMHAMYLSLLSKFDRAFFRPSIFIATAKKARSTDRQVLRSGDIRKARPSTGKPEVPYDLISLPRPPQAIRRTAS